MCFDLVVARSFAGLFIGSDCAPASVVRCSLFVVSPFAEVDVLPLSLRCLSRIHIRIRTSASRITLSVHAVLSCPVMYLMHLLTSITTAMISHVDDL